MPTNITEQGPAWSLSDVAILVVEAAAVTAIDLFYARTVAPDPQIQTLAFEGDDTTQEIDEIQYLRYVITCDKRDWDAVQQIFGKVKTLLPTPEETWGMYFGDDAEVAGIAAGLRYDIKAKDESVTPNVAYTERTTVPVGTLKLIRPKQVEWKAKATFDLHFTASKTTVDLIGAALSGVPTGGAYYRVGRVP
jgi:hypothetical protein